MLCILKRDPATQEIIGWIIATDCADAKNQAYGAGEQALAELLYRMEGPLEHTLPSQQDLPLPGPRYTMLRA
jgi:hypothetical protein